MGGNVVLGCVACAIVGGLILALAAWQIHTGNVRFLHSYHYVNVPVANQPAFAMESGRRLAVTGACVVPPGFSLLLPGPASDAVGVALIITLFVTIIMTCRDVVRHNGSLLS